MLSKLQKMASDLSATGQIWNMRYDVHTFQKSVFQKLCRPHLPDTVIQIWEELVAAGNSDASRTFQLRRAARLAIDDSIAKYPQNGDRLKVAECVIQFALKPFTQDEIDEDFQEFIFYLLESGAKEDELTPIFEQSFAAEKGAAEKGTGGNGDIHH